ncbi:MAG: diguanylate cyclase [candidate division WOR-3 bacterium]
MGVEEKLRGLEPVYYDDLTGIFNKRFFNNLKNFLSDKIVLSIFDIDDFKSINDIYGHQTGDFVIKKVSEILTEFSSRGDFPIRYGGDEFILISSLKTKEDFVRVLESFKERIEKNPIIFNNNMIRITLSFGVSEGDVENIESVLENADNALYSSKEKGKNCITIFEKNRIGEIKIPFRCEREIRKCLNEGKNVIIKGGFRSGKTYLKNVLEREYKNFCFYDFDKYFDNVSDKNICFFYNPLSIEEDGNLNRILNIVKKTDYREFTIENLYLDEISRNLELFLKEKSIFLLNFLFDITSGNRFLVSKFIREKKELFDFDLYEFLNDDFELGQDLESKFESILKYGLVIDTHKIKSKNDFKILEYLSNRLVLKNINGYYRYMYPPLYFYLAKKFKIKLKYPESLKTFEDLKFGFLKGDDKNLIKVSERLYYYGDNILSKKMVERIKSENEKKLVIMSKIFISEGNINGAEIFSQKIKDKEERTNIKILLDLIKGKKLNLKMCKSNTQKLLYLSFLYNNLELKQFKNLMNKIQYENLDNRQKMTYDFLVGNFNIIIEDYGKAEFFLERCKKNCRDNNFIGDLGKVFMSLGILYDDMENFELSLENYNRALEIFKYSNMDNALQSLYLNLAVLYSKIGDFSTSLDIFSSLLAGVLVQTNIGLKRRILNNLSHLYFNLFDFEKSVYYLNELLKTFSEKEKIPDHIVFHKVKLDLLSGFWPSTKLDYLNKNDIINKLEKLTINLVVKYKKELGEEVLRKFIEKLSSISPGKNILTKTELLIFLLIFYKERNDLKEILKKKVFENLTFLRLQTRIDSLINYLE